MQNWSASVRGSAVIRAVLFLVCFACFWASSLTVRHVASNVPVSLHYTSRVVEIGLCLAIAAVAWRRGVSERSVRRCVFAAVGVYVAVELVRILWVSATASEGVSMALSAASGVANGAAVASMSLLLGRGLFSFGPRAVAVIVPSALGCAHGIFLLSDLLPGSAAPWLKIALLLVAVAGFALWNRLGGPQPLPAAAGRLDKDSGPVFGPQLASLSLWLGMVVFPLLYGFMAQICTTAHVSSGLFDISTELVGIGFMALLAAGSLFFHERLDTEALFAVVLSVFATAFLFLPVFWNNEVFVAGFIMKCGFTVYTAMLWVLLPRLVGPNAPARCFWVLGLAFGVYHAALMAGRLTAYLLTANHLLSYQALSFVALAVVWLLSMTALVVVLANRRSRAASSNAEADHPRSYDEAFDAFAAGCGLSSREGAVCREYARGRTVEHIADALGVSQETVKTHLKRSYAKCGCHSRQELIDQIDGHRDRSMA